MNVTVANAPISYGAFELTVGIDPSVPSAELVLDEVAAAGYAGIDLGPVGYLGEGPVLAERLAARGLGLAGAYLELPFSDPAALPALWPDLDAMLDT
ncbi:MAG: sugar phosphate isomerase/epimerase family protein, partial [Acidimicrobiales bacterium]